MDWVNELILTRSTSTSRTKLIRVRSLASHMALSIIFTATSLEPDAFLPFSEAYDFDVHNALNGESSFGLAVDSSTDGTGETLLGSMDNGCNPATDTSLSFLAKLLLCGLRLVTLFPAEPWRLSPLPMLADRLNANSAVSSEASHTELKAPWPRSLINFRGVSGPPITCPGLGSDE